MYSGGIYLETADWRWGCDAEIQAGANAWRNVEGVMMHRKITRKLKGKVLDSCIVPASTYGLETLALSERQQHKLQGCENNLVRIIAGVRRVERNTMIDLREEVGTKMYGFFWGFYIAQYPVRWTAQSALHFCSPGRTVHSDTDSASPGSILIAG